MKTVAVFASMLAILAHAPRLAACWGAIDPESFAHKCPIIVSGTVARIDEIEKDQDRGHAVAFIAIHKIHKNILTDEPLKPGGHVRVLMSSRKSRVRASTDIHYPVGTAGIWLIEVRDDGHLHVDIHPVQRQPQEKEKEFEARGMFRQREVVRRKGDPEPSFTRKDLLAERRKRQEEERIRAEKHAAHSKQVDALGKELARSEHIGKSDFARFAKEPEAVRRDLFNQPAAQFKFSEDNLLAFCALVLKHETSENIRTGVFAWLDARTSKRAAALLVEGLQDKSPSVRLFFCQALWHAQDPAVGDHVVKLLGDEKRDVRLVAVRTLGFLKATQHVPAILRLFERDSKEDDDDWCFAEALSQLGEVDVALRCIKACMKSTNPNVRDFVIRALHQVKSDKAIPVAIGLLVPELRRTLNEAKHSLDDGVLTGLFRVLEERTKQRLGTDVIAWHAWWTKNHARYGAEQIHIDERAVGALLQEYRSKKQ